MALKLELKTQQQLDDLKSYFQQNDLNSEKERSQDLIVATNGYTYQISKIKKLSNKDLEKLEKEEEVYFYIPTEKNRISLSKLKKTFKQKKKPTLIHNTPLVEFLSDPTKIPTCSISLFPMVQPVIMPDEHSFDYLGIKKSLENKSECPLDRKPMNQDEICANITFENVLWLHYFKTGSAEAFEALNNILVSLRPDDEILKHAPYLANKNWQQLLQLEAQLEQDRIDYHLVHTRQKNTLRPLSLILMISALILIPIFLTGPLGVLAALAIAVGAVITISIASGFTKKLFDRMLYKKVCDSVDKQAIVASYRNKLLNVDHTKSVIDDNRTERLLNYKKAIETSAQKIQTPQTTKTAGLRYNSVFATDAVPQATEQQIYVPRMSAR